MPFEPGNDAKTATLPRVLAAQDDMTFLTFAQSYLFGAKVHPIRRL
jgi:hypothetical protein